MDMFPVNDVHSLNELKFVELMTIELLQHTEFSENQLAKKLERQFQYE